MDAPQSDITLKLGSELAQLAIPRKLADFFPDLSVGGTALTLFPKETTFTHELILVKDPSRFGHALLQNISACLNHLNAWLGDTIIFHRKSSYEYDIEFVSDEDFDELIIHAGNWVGIDL